MSVVSIIIASGLLIHAADKTAVDKEVEQFGKVLDAYSDCMIGSARRNYGRSDADVPKVIAEDCKGPMHEFGNLFIKNEKPADQAKDWDELEREHGELAKTALAAVQKCQNPHNGADIKKCDPMAAFHPVRR